MNKMLILLEQLHLENDVRQLKNANIDRVVVNADNSYVFYVSASHIVPLEEIRKLFSAKNEFPYPSDFDSIECHLKVLFLLQKMFRIMRCLF